MTKQYPKRQSESDCCQEVQCPEDKHAPGYNNDTPNNWLRGNGLKPGFDRNGSGRK